MSNYKNHAYYTHQPYLIEILKNTKGNILECGCGDGSTTLIKEQIKDSGRTLISLESNLEWLNKYIHLNDDFHKLYHIDADNNDVMETGLKWSNFIEKNKLNDFEIVFIDSSPWLSRKCCFDYFLDKARIIIIHDFDYFPTNNIIGNVINTKESFYNNKKQIEIECNLDNDVKNYKLYYPPKEYFIGETGPPTLICSNIMNKNDFQELINIIDNNLKLYY